MSLRTSLRMRGESIHGTCKGPPWEDHLWQGGITYGALDGPGDHPWQQKLAVDGPGRPIFGGPSTV